MKKITIILMCIILFSSFANAEYEKELPVSSFTEVNFEEVIAHGEEKGWRDYYMNLVNNEIGITGEEIYYVWRVVPYIPKISWVNNIAKKEISKIDYDVEEEKEKFEINNEKFGFEILLTSQNKNNIKSKNLNIIYEDNINEQIDIKDNHIVNEDIQKESVLLYSNTIHIMVPINSINIEKFSMFIINQNYERLDLHWTFKPAE